MNPLYYGCSETGSVRKNNEDAILMRAAGNAALFFVADGIGGKAHGEVVSGMLRDAYSRWWDETFPTSDGDIDFQKGIEAIKEQLLQINREVVLRFGEWNAGSTIALLFLCGRNCAYLSSGDSRIYRARGLRLQQITRDDTFDNLPKERAIQYGKSSSGKLAGAVGISGRLDFSVRTDTVQFGDSYFLCTDGVYRFVPNQKLRNRLLFGGRFLTPKRVTELLCEDVERNGSGDNYSMIFVKAR